MPAEGGGNGGADIGLGAIDVWCWEGDRGASSPGRGRFRGLMPARKLRALGVVGSA